MTKTARDIMSKDVDLIKMDESVQTAAKMMRDGNYGIIPVYENDRLQGLITDRDITIRLVAEGKDASKEKVRDFMTKSVLYCYEDDSIEEVSNKMSDTYHRRFPVLNRDKRLVGILSIGDLAKAEETKTNTHKALNDIASASVSH